MDFGCDGRGGLGRTNRTQWSRVKSTRTRSDSPGASVSEWVHRTRGGMPRVPLGHPKGLSLYRPGRGRRRLQAAPPRTMEPTNPATPVRDQPSLPTLRNGIQVELGALT